MEEKVFNRDYNRFEYRNIQRHLIKYWYLFVISFILFYTISTLYIRYALPIYNSRVVLLIKDDKKKLGAENFLEGFELLSSSRNISNEIEMIKSHSIVLKTIQRLKFDVSYFVRGNIKSGELYKSSPILIAVDTLFPSVKNVPFFVEVDSDSSFTIYQRKVHTRSWWDILSRQKDSERIFEIKGKFGKPCHSEYFSIIVQKTPGLKENYKDDVDFYFVINDLDDMAYMYSAKLNIEMVSKYSTILNLSISGSVVQKDLDFLNQLCETYMQTGLYEKNQIVTNTINFIDAQLSQVSDSLKETEGQLEKFRVAENIMDIPGAVALSYEKLNTLEAERAQLIVQDRYYKYLLNYIETNQDIHKMTAPSAVGINDPLLNKLISELYDLYAEQATLSFSAKEKNPTYQMLDLQIKSTRKALVENLSNLIASSAIYLDDNQNRLTETSQLFNNLPRKERHLVNIQRKFTLNDNIFNYLLQKRMEASIAKAANIPDNKIVNRAKVLDMIYPNKSKIRNNFILIAILLPLLIIGLIVFFNDTIPSNDIITLKTSIPIIGTVSHYSGASSVPVLESPKSQLSESVRSIRVNLQYLASNKENKIIGITSSISGEGKTFFALNMSASLAYAGNHVILIGADLRKPTLHEKIDVSNEIGLSSYLINQASIDDIIKSIEIPNLHFIPAGPIPPNPTELLESEKMEVLLNELSKRYQYIVIDAPPVGLVIDYFVLNKFVDVNLFIIRQNYTKLSMLDDLNILHDTGKLSKVFLIFNDAKKLLGYGNKYSYGYGYGYGYNYGDGYNSYEFTDKRKKGLFGRIVKGIKNIFSV